jgi:hypothetical protein
LWDWGGNFKFGSHELLKLIFSTTADAKRGMTGYALWSRLLFRLGEETLPPIIERGR